MNVYRGLGDLSRMVGTIIFFLMAWKGNTSAISRKSQELYLMVSITRYLDLFYTFYSMYNALMKILYISLGAATVACLYFKEPGCSTYNAAQDSVQHWLHIVVPCIFIAVAYKSQDPRGFYPLEDTTELMWTFSVVLESVAMLPQLLMVRRSFQNGRKYHCVVRDAICVPLFLFGIYRFLYLLNWGYRAMTEPSFAFMLSHTRLVLTVSAFVQVLIYSEFFYIVLRPYLCPARAELAKADQTGAEEIGAGVDPEVGGATVNGTQDVVKTIAQQQQQPATSMEPTGNEAPRL
mmetsp:Transcript_20153/g.56127  ORF Transcript_20153/g.56127 Transcript_20153/m.56127 type:complete len:291 (-) Transcript_20153:942-1814(-)